MPELVSIKIITDSPEITMRIGEITGTILKNGDIVALSGDIGAGKTCFTKGIASGLGLAETSEVTSPTFNLLNEYLGQINLYHLDIYRLKGIEELYDIGFEEYLKAKGVLVIEWADKIKQELPDRTVFVDIGHISEFSREINISAGCALLNEIFSALNEEGFKNGASGAKIWRNFSC